VGVEGHRRELCYQVIMVHNENNPVEQLSDFVDIYM
jgi:hypothetical protein